MESQVIDVQPHCFFAYCQTCMFIFDHDKCQGHAPLNDHEKFIRASDECICRLCKKEYYSHPSSEHLASGGVPFLRRLCDGVLVKL